MARPANLAAPGARRIALAATRPFAHHGYAGTSMADVASAAKVSKATVFHHFRSKRQLYEALIGDAKATSRPTCVIDALGPGWCQQQDQRADPLGNRSECRARDAVLL